MKSIIAMLVAMVTLITGFFTSMFKPEPKPEEPTETITETTGETSTLSLIKDLVLAVKNDMPALLEALKNLEDLDEIEKEANEFLNNTLNEIQEKLPNDFKIEVDDFDVEKISSSQLTAIKNDCEETGKYNPDKISAGFTASGKGRLTANGKTYNIKGSAVIIRVTDTWVLYDFDYEIPDDFNIGDILDLI